MKSQHPSHFAPSYASDEPSCHSHRRSSCFTRCFSQRTSSATLSYDYF